jgi:hypothetical protein
MVDVQYLREAYCDAIKYMMGAKVSIQAAKKFDMDRFNLKQLNDVEVREHYQVEISNRSAALENLDDDVDVK